MSVSIILFQYLATKEQKQLYAYIYSENALVQVIDLTAVEEPYSFTIGDKNEDYNIIEVRHNSIGITAASCSDRVCMNTGFIETNLVPVVCLPNKLVIEIHTENTSNETVIDAVTE